MRKITKVALACLLLGIVSFLGQAISSESRPGILFTFAIALISLSMILAFYLVLTSPREEKVYYLKYMAVGFLAGIILEAVLFSVGPAGRAPLALTLFNKRHVLGLLFVGNAPPVLALFTSLFLNKKFPKVSEEVRPRLMSIIALLVAYVLGSYLVFAVSGRGFLFFAPFFAFAMLVYGFYLYFETGLFIYASFSILVAAYVVTQDIKGVHLRILWVLILIILMFAVAGAPLTLGLLS